MGRTELYMRGWFRANWMTSSGKSLVELKVPKVLLGHWGWGEGRYSRDIDGWGLDRRPSMPSLWEHEGGWGQNPALGIREEMQPCPGKSEAGNKLCLMETFSHP